MCHTNVGMPRCKITKALPTSPRHNRVLKNRSRPQKLLASCNEKFSIGQSVSLTTVKKVVFNSSFGAGFGMSSVIPNPDTSPSSLYLGILMLFIGNAIGFNESF